MTASRCAVIAAAAVIATPIAAAAAGWTVPIAASTSGLAQSLLVAAPTGVSAACAAPATDKTVTVTWDPVAHATYDVYRSSQSATAGFALTASGVTTTSWASGRLSPNRTYWFQVVAVVGGWQGPASAATAPLTIATRAPFCG
jgi:hypothetical protein